jgi:hypothetical protein
MRNHTERKTSVSVMRNVFRPNFTFKAIQSTDFGHALTAIIVLAVLLCEGG